MFDITQKRETRSEFFTIRIEKSVKNRLAYVARKYDLSCSQAARKAIMEWIEIHDYEEKHSKPDIIGY